MSHRFTSAAGIVALLVIITAAVAQERATIVLRSGERISGDLVDMGGAGFTVRAGGSTRQVPTGDVAVIEFGGGGTSFPQNELDKVSGGRHLFVLTNGQTVTGRLYDVGGTRPLRLRAKTDSGEREFSSSEVRRVYLSRPDASRTADTGLSTTGTTGPGEVRVPANQRWTDTGITVRKGDRVSFNARGEIRFSNDPNDVAVPAGAKNGRMTTGGPMPGVLAGALLGRIGPTAVFAIGNQTTPLTMPADGRLFLGINDDRVEDNHGEFIAEVRPAGSPRRR